MNKFAFFALVVIVAVVADIGTKTIAERTLATETSAWKHSITRDVDESFVGRTWEDWAVEELGVNTEDAAESRTLYRMYRPAAVEAESGEVARRLNPAGAIDAAGAVEIRTREVEIVDGFWRHTYARNPGAAFGFLAGANRTFSRTFFIIISILAVFVVLNLLRDVKPTSKLLIATLGFIVGGAMGNLIDRIRYGYVVDFIEWYVTVGDEEKIWPTFNVADSFISLGVTLMIAMILFGKVDFLEEEDDEQADAA